jgi:hypothetical protein
MLSFLLELLKRAWPRFLSAIGTTGLGFFVSAIAEFAATLIVTCIVIWISRGRAAMKEHIAQNVTVAAMVFVIVFLILYGPIFHHQVLLEKSRIIEESDKIQVPHPRLPSLPARWDARFMVPFCYVKLETVRPQFGPQLINGHWGFRLFVLSSTNRPWDGVAVRIRRQDRMGFLVNQEIGTLRLEGAILDQWFVPEVGQPYLVIVLTRSQYDYFFETLTLTQSNGSFEQQIQIYRSRLHGSPTLLFDSVAQGRLP